MLKVVHLGDLMNHVTTDQLQTTKPLISKVLKREIKSWREINV